MSSTQFVKFHNLVQIVSAFCWEQKPVRFRAIDRDSEGFSGAIVLQVTVQTAVGAPETDFCLRGWPPDSFPKERLQGLHRLLAHIQRCGVRQVAVPLPNQFGSTIYTESGQFWQLEPWLAGRADYWTNPSDARLRNAMTVLASWHEAASRFDARPAESTWFKQHVSAVSPTVLDRLERVRRFRTTDAAHLRQLVEKSECLESWGTQFAELRELALEILGHFERSASSVATRLVSFRDVRFRLHPCLRDIWHDHVLFQDDEVSGLIDPSAAKSETPATDLARLLGSFFAETSESDERWNIALAAYRNARPLSDQEAQLARVLDDSTALLSGLTWLERLFVDRVQYSNTSRVLDRVAQITARMRQLYRPGGSGELVI